MFEASAIRENPHKIYLSILSVSLIATPAHLTMKKASSDELAFKTMLEKSLVSVHYSCKTE